MEKTLEELKQGLAECNKEPYLRDCKRRCPYYTVDVSCLGNMRRDALEHLQQLEARNAQLERSGGDGSKV